MDRWNKDTGDIQRNFILKKRRGRWITPKRDKIQRKFDKNKHKKQKSELTSEQILRITLS